MWYSRIADTQDMSLNAVLQRHAGRKGTDIVGIARIPLSRIPIHDDAALAALAEQQAVSSSSLPLHICLHMANAQSVQCYMQQLCPHMEHVKTEKCCLYNFFPAMQAFMYRRSTPTDTCCCTAS